jgi:hypothetical protein
MACGRNVAPQLAPATGSATLRHPTGADCGSLGGEDRNAHSRALGSSAERHHHHLPVHAAACQPAVGAASDARGAQSRSRSWRTGRRSGERRPPSESACWVCSGVGGLTRPRWTATWTPSMPKLPPCRRPSMLSSGNCPPKSARRNGVGPKHCCAACARNWTSRCPQPYSGRF